MLIVRRAWRNLARSPGRTALLTVVLAVVIALGVIGLAVEAGAQNGIAGVRQGLGNEVRLAQNVAGIRGRAAGELRRGVDFLMGDLPVVTEELSNSLAGSRYVVEYDHNFRGWAVSETLIPVIEEYEGGVFQILPGMPMRRQSRGFTLVGNSLPSRIEDFSGGRRVLIEGRLYTAEEVLARTPVAVIDEVLAAQNGLAVGSRFALQGTVGGQEFEFEVVGISRDEEMPEGEQQFTRLLFGASNTIYVPYTVVQDLSGRPGELTSTSYYLDDPEHIEAFRAQAEAAGLDTEKYMLWSSDTMYESMAGPLLKLAGFARTGVIAVVAAGALVICLLMTIVTRERKLEIGILRALGAGRGSVSGQLAVETLTICLVAVVLGVIAGGMLAQVAADRLLARELALSGNLGMIGRGLMGRGGISIFGLPGMVAPGASPTAVDAVLGLAELGMIAGVGLLLALLGSLVAAYWSMKMHPASILAART